MRGLDRFPPQWLGALLVAIVGGALAVPPVRAQAQTAAPAPDFARGFELLRSAGLPDVKDWTYVRLESDYGPRGEMGIDAILPGKQAGNAWLAPESGPVKLQRVLLDGSTLVAVSSDSDEQNHAAGMREAEALGLQFVPGKMKDVNFSTGDAKQNNEAADAARLAAEIAKMAGDDEGKERLLQYRGQVVSVFFMAAHYHRRGYASESAKIVTALQKALPRPEALIELSVDKLGDMRLEQCVARFRSDRDWKALQSSLESVMADFPELWSSRPLAERLLTQVKARSAGQAPPPVAEGPFALTDEQREWWNKVTLAPPADKKDDELAMMGMHTSGSQQWAQAWLMKRLEMPEDLNRYWQTFREESLAPFDPSKDWDWITVMAAALGDQTMTMTSGPGHRGMFDSTWSSFDPEQPLPEPSEMELEQRWEQLGVPVTRDEIARAFLGVLLPLSDEFGGSDGVRRMSVEDLRESARSWSAKMAGKKGLELTRLYFKEGSEDHRRIMASLLARTGDEKDLALLEEVALNEAYNHFELATQIVQKRKASGKPFLEKFKARLTEQWKEERNEEELPDYLKGQLQALDGLVSGKGMKELFVEYADKKMDDNAFMQAIQSMQEGYEWKQEDVEAAFSAMGKVPASEARQRYVLMEIASRGLRSLLKMGEEGATPESRTPASGDPPSQPPPEWVVKLLRECIEQNREVTMKSWDGSSTRLSRHGYFLAETLWNPAGTAMMQELHQQLSSEFFWPYIEARGAAWLEGKQPPPAPDAARVTDARKGEINAALQKLGEGGWPEYFAGLNLDEKLAASELVEEAKPADSWKKALLTVTELGEVPASKADSWSALKGRVLDGALAKQLLELCQQTYSDDGKDVMGSVTFRSHYRGIRIQAGEPEAEVQRHSDIGMFLRGMREGAPMGTDVTALAYVRWRDRSRNSGAVVGLRGKDGAWKSHTAGKEDEAGGFFPFRPALSAEDFEKGVNGLLSEWTPGSQQQQQWYFDFGLFKVPGEPSEKE